MSKSKPASYKKNTVVSKDGTVIGYRELGAGPGLVLVHGGLKSAQDFTKLSTILSHHFTVYVPDRRGRGMSGSAGGAFSVMREVEDLQALVDKTGAHNIFALSAGALVTLRTALATPPIEKIGLYEPPFSVHGSTPTKWVARYKNQLAGGKIANALVTGMKGLGTVPIFVKIPRFVLVPSLALVMLLQGKGTQDNVSIRSLVPTWQYDMEIIDEMSDTLDTYKALSAQVLLMGGTKSPRWLATSLDNLAKTLPHVDRITYPGLGHDGPEDDSHPELVAQDLRTFFSSASAKSL